MRPIHRIVVHCSATREGAHYTAADIDRWHRARGWNGIGYHAVVLLDGTVEPGRPHEQVGAHVAGHNHDSLGICYIGGVDSDGKTPKDTRTERQRAALLAIVRAWMSRYQIPVHQVFGHRELDPYKACPSFDPATLRAQLADVSEPTPMDQALALRSALAAALSSLPTLDLRGSNAVLAARLLQSEIGTPADAIIGPQTWAAIATELAEYALTGREPLPAPVPPPVSFAEGAGHD